MMAQKQSPFQPMSAAPGSSSVDQEHAGCIMRDIASFSACVNKSMNVPHVGAPTQQLIAPAHPDLLPDPLAVSEGRDADERSKDVPVAKNIFG